MRLLFTLLSAVLILSPIQGQAPIPAQTISKNIPYVAAGHERQVLDVYAPKAQNLPVVF